MNKVGPSGRPDQTPHFGDLQFKRIPTFVFILVTGIRWVPQYPFMRFFFNRGDTEGTTSSKILCSMFVYVLSKFVYRTDFVVFE